MFLKVENNHPTKHQKCFQACSFIFCLWANKCTNNYFYLLFRMPPQNMYKTISNKMPKFVTEQISFYFLLDLLIREEYKVFLLFKSIIKYIYFILFLWLSTQVIHLSKGGGKEHYFLKSQVMNIIPYVYLQS